MSFLFSKITSSQTTVIHYNGKSLSYKQLLDEVRFRASYFIENPGDYLLCNTSELENLLNFLAIMYTGQKAVFGGRKLNLIQKNTLAQKHNLKVLDFPIFKFYEVSNPVNVTNCTYFLGILTPDDKLIWKDYQSWFSAFDHQSEIFKVCLNDHVFVLDSLAYSANLNTVLHALWAGAKITFSSLTESNKWPQIIKDNKITSLFLIPSHLNLLKSEDRFINIKSVVTAGEKVLPHLGQKIIDNYPNATITEYYGNVELGHITYLQNKEIIEKPTSVGKPFPGVKISIHDNKIKVKSLYVSPQYRTNATVSDIGYLDADGYLVLLGRSGRLFQRRKINYFAEELGNPFFSKSKIPKNATEKKIELTKSSYEIYYTSNETPSIDFHCQEYQSVNSTPIILIIILKIHSKKPIDEDAMYCLIA